MKYDVLLKLFQVVICSIACNGKETTCSWYEANLYIGFRNCEQIIMSGKENTAILLLTLSRI